MKKTLILLALVFLAAFGAKAQQTPIFQTPIYFEDAVGNKDTIFVGFDSTANEVYNPQFGEENITSPFDSIFEVRAVHYFDFGWGEGDYMMTKKIVTGTETAWNDPQCIAAGSVLFFINSEYQPITIRWTNETFRNLYCLEPTFFTPDRLYHMVWPWNWIEIPDIRYQCTYFDSIYTLSLGEQFQASMEVPYIAMKPVEGIGIDSIWGVSLEYSINWSGSPCQFLLNTEAPSHSGHITEMIIPNPATGIVHIWNSENETPERVVLSDCNGRIVHESEAERWEFALDITPLPPGIYFYRSVYADGRQGSGKVVKWGE